MSEINLINGDCLEVMKEIKSNTIDLIITSPPYNLGKTHTTGNFRHSPYKDNLEETKYQEWQIKVLNECFRILNKTGSLFYNHKNRIKEGTLLIPYSWIFKSKFNIRQEIVWFNGSQNFNKCRFYPMTERIYWLTKTKETKFFNKINHHDLFKWQAVGTGGEHKRAYPIKLVTDIIKCFPDSKLIFDPFTGSGTTAEACKRENKNFIGSEISKKYYELALRNIKTTVRQLELF